MLLNTERLTLQLVSLQDLENVHALHSLPEVDEFNTLGIPASIKETEKIMAGWMASQKTEPIESYTFSILNKETKEFVGRVGIKMGKANYYSAETWYKLLPKQWNRGYATEVVKEILRFCFTELKLHRIEAGCAVENVASIKVLEKCGFIREGRKRKILPIRGQWVDNYFYAILDEDNTDLKL